MTANLEESELIELAKHDNEAFGVLYERYHGRIYNYVYYRTGNVAEAEDLTARIFVRAMRHIGTYEDKGLPFSAWLYRIAHNLVANWHRDRSRRPLIALDDIFPCGMSSKINILSRPSGVLCLPARGNKGSIRRSKQAPASARKAQER
ncbi:MAG: sigma-70 family RNA polymerase sigma factor [Chloroflexi bacterium]|nr:sigma-70 family RNA polymerase sigma factor [Chloroflexota bacterium]